MAPSGGVKGFSIGLLVEVLCAALAGGQLGPDQGSFTDNDGKPIDNGQFFIAIDPQAFSGGSFDGTIKRLIASILEQEGARLPNARRVENQRRLAHEGLFIEDDLLARLRGMA
jgi:(2R)-3-sulfolactate dehydrogenase (NADP+)